jgi:glycosyltransferase involved in cell wall biosynthesis
MISVVIRTINRETLHASILSAGREFDEVIVVADASPLNRVALVKVIASLPDKCKVKVLETGQRFDKYGSAALNMGACAVSNDYFCLLDDDDEFVRGAGEYMRQFVMENKDHDIFIPGLRFNNGMELCKSPGLEYGNVAVPTFKTEWALKVPITPLHLNKFKVPSDAIDLSHVLACVAEGAKVSWYEKILYLVRPHMPGTNGRGK